MTLNSIESINRCCENIARDESRVHAFVEDTLDIDRIRGDAEDLLQRYPDGAQRPPLFGVLVGVKDIIHVDGYPTGCGSKIPAAELTGPEAEIVTRLKQAGAIIAGKTITVEFACSDPGPTRNPVNLEHSPGGSSSGSAASVAAGFVDLALGSQTGGSVIRPAAYCGIVGFKPSFGRIDTAGVFPYSRSMDHVGLFSRDLEGLERAMSVMAPAWRSTGPAPSQRIALPAGAYLEIAGEAALDHYYEVVERVRRGAVDIVEHPVLADIDRQNKGLDRLIDAEAYRVHASWFERYRDLYAPLMLAALERGRATSDSELALLLDEARRKQLEMQQIMRDLAVDIWLAPAATDVAPKGLGYTGDHRMNSIWSYTGLPVVTLPSGRNHAGLPYGLQIIGRYNQDERLLATAKLLSELLST